jgi:hypothetical protein
MYGEQEIEWAEEQAGPDGKAEAYVCKRSNSYPWRRPGFNPRSVHVGFVVDKMALGQVFLLSTSVSPRQFAFYQILHSSHLPSGANTVGHFRPKYKGTQSHPNLRIRTLVLYPLVGNFTGSATVGGQSVNIFMFAEMLFPGNVLFLVYWKKESVQK